MAKISIQITNWEKHNPRMDQKGKRSWIRLNNDLFTSQKLFELSIIEKAVWVFLLTQCADEKGTVELNIEWAEHVAQFPSGLILNTISKLERLKCLSRTDLGDLRTDPGATDGRDETDGTGRDMRTELRATTPAAPLGPSGGRKSKRVVQSSKAALPSWDEIKPVVFEKVRELHGMTRRFFETQWVRLLAYDEDKPYKNRRSGATNWFNSSYTLSDWEKYKSTSDDEDLPTPATDWILQRQKESWERYKAQEAADLAAKAQAPIQVN